MNQKTSLRDTTRKSVIGAFLGCLMLLSACAGGETVPDTGGGDDTTTTSVAAEPTTTSAGAEPTTTSASEPVESHGVFKVGALNPLTGPFTQFGVDVNAGFAHYVNEVRGGELAGWEIEILDEDGASDVDTSTTKARQLVEQDGVNFMFGLVHSGVAYAVAPYINESEVPFVITVAGADGLTQHDASPWIFRVNYTGSQDNMPLGEYACNELGYETAVIVALDYAFGWESSGGFARTYEDAGCHIVQELYSPLATDDWVPIVQQIDTSADVVFGAIAGGDVPRFVQAYRGTGVEQPLIGIGGLTDEFVLPQMGTAAEGIITTLHYSAALETPENQEFVAAMESIGTQPGVGAESGWSAAVVLEAALEIAGDQALDPEVLRDALRQVEVVAPRGPMRFDDLQQVVYNIYLREAMEVDGEWVNAVTDTFADVSQFWTYDQEDYLALPLLADLKGTWADE